MKLYPVEGNRQQLDGGAMFGNAPKELWKQWIMPDDHNRIPLATRTLLVQTDEGKSILFEAGVGAFFEPKYRKRYGIIEEEHKLLENLDALGVKEEAIDAIVLSHLHFDHAGGVLSAYGDGEPRLLFPNAHYYVSASHWERARNPLPREKASFIPFLPKLLEESGRLKLVDGERSDLDFVSFRIVDGHTVGLMISMIELEEGPLVYVSDLMPGLPWIHLPITMGFDRFPELLMQEKQALLEELLERNGKVFFTHDPNVACARVMRDEKGKYYGEPIDVTTLR